MLKDGAVVRWVGDFDLPLLKELAPAPRRLKFYPSGYTSGTSAGNMRTG